MSKIQAPDALLQAQKLAHLSDTKIRLPILGWRFGLDFLIGLIPVVGDLIMLGVSLRIITLAKKMQVPNSRIALMLRNIVFDFVLGLIPFVGDIIDFFYKANVKNVRIMEMWWVSQHHADIVQNTQQALDKWQHE